MSSTPFSRSRSSADDALDCGVGKQARRADDDRPHGIHVYAREKGGQVGPYTGARLTAVARELVGAALIPRRFRIQNA